MIALALVQRHHERTDAELVAEVQRAAQRLSIATRSWSTVHPRRAAIDEAMNTAHGLSRTLAAFHAAQAKRTP